MADLWVLESGHCLHTWAPELVMLLVPMKAENWAVVLASLPYKLVAKWATLWVHWLGRHLAAASAS